MLKEILSSHTSPETAYVVDEYPYGFRLRCKIRYWLEHDPKRGTRFWSQTTNPKVSGEPWNKPKASTYAYLAGCMYLNEDDHVTWSALNEYSTAQESIDWYETYKAGLTPEVNARVEAWIRAKLAYEAKRDNRAQVTMS